MKLSYLQQGFGPALPLVLLHPFPLNAKFWSNQLAGLSKGRHVIAVNFRGFGGSKLEGPDAYTVEKFATDIRKTMATAQISKAVFGGCSMGGYVLFELWRQAPELIGGLILADTRAEADTEEARGRRLELIDHIEKTGTAELSDIAASYLSDNTRTTNPNVLQDVMSWATESSAENIIKTVRMLAERPDSTITLSTISVPTLVLVGEHDHITPVDSARKIHSSIPDASMVIIPDAGHLSPIENPQAVNAAILDFLSTSVNA